eukprot:3640874-Amphidinium_carterae.1
MSFELPTAKNNGRDYNSVGDQMEAKSLPSHQGQSERRNTESRRTPTRDAKRVQRSQGLTLLRGDCGTCSPRPCNSPQALLSLPALPEVVEEDRGNRSSCKHTMDSGRFT